MDITNSSSWFWNALTQFLSITGVRDVTVWQDVLISALLIPVVIFLGSKLLVWWNSVKPMHQILKNCLNQNKDIFIFHSQMSGADNNWDLNPDQKYITRFPDPLPTDQAHLGIQKKKNIDPVLSKAEAECLTDIYNILGRAGKVKNIKIGDLINDWNVWSNPIFSVGFNPKTHALIENCDPIYFELMPTGILRIKNGRNNYDSLIPNDAAIIQKTHIKGTNVPVFMLAGLGTTGTSASGYILNQNIKNIGKLFGSNPFCVFLKVRIHEGRTAARIDKLYPKPNLFHVILHPFLFCMFRKNNFFKYS